MQKVMPLPDMAAHARATAMRDISHKDSLSMPLAIGP